MSFKNRLDALEALLGRVGFALAGLAAALLLPMMFLVTGDVIGRSTYIQHPIPAVFEINSYFLIVAAVFFPLACVHRQKEHVFVSLFTDRLGCRAIAGLEALSSLMGIFVFSLICYFGVEQAVTSTLVGEHTSGVVDVPIWMAKWLMPIGCFVFCLELALDALRNTMALFGPSSGNEKGA